AMDPYDDQSHPQGIPQPCINSHKIRVQCGINKMVCLTISRFTAISGAKMMYPQPNLSVSDCIIPR
ncbi:MAG: hypothetical protein PVG36_09470, partial [Methyloceanibacter sp.]